MNLIENEWYEITAWGATFKVLYTGQLEEDMGYNCDMCGKPRGRLHTFRTYDNIPNEDGSNFTGQYFFGSECIKKISVKAHKI